MATIVLTDEARAALAAMAPLPFNGLLRRRHDGAWDVDVSGVILKRLKELRLAGEDFSATILRVVSLDLPKGGPEKRHLIKISSDASEWSFVGGRATVDLTNDDRDFVTLGFGEMERLLGHPLQIDAEGIPVILSEKDKELISVALKVRHSILSNPHLDREAKARVIKQLGRIVGNGNAENVAKEIVADEERAAALKMRLDGMVPGERKKFIREYRSDLRQQKKTLDASIAEKKSRGLWLHNVLAAYDEAHDWAGMPLVMQKPPATMFHHLRQAMIEGSALITADLDGQNSSRDFDEFWKDAAVFVVEHDWAAAFSEGQDYEGGEFKLPDEVCAFEFRISGRHVITVAFEMDGRLYLQPVPMTANGWLIPRTVYYSERGKWEIERGGKVDPAQDKFANLIELLGKQIKAICIALDAEVAVSEVVRAPHKLNHARERRGKLPVNSYHVVSLAKRSRTPRLERDPSEPGTYTKKRLHFRRGHWRHFDDHKTWIKWMLVGDPDLGFVDKHYKL